MMLFTTLSFALFQTYAAQSSGGGMWNGANTAEGGGAQGGGGTWNTGMGFGGPPGGFGPVPPEFAAAMGGSFNTQPPPIPMGMMGGTGMMGNGMMGGGMMGGHGGGMMGGQGMMGMTGNGMMGQDPGMMGSQGMMGNMMGGQGMMGGQYPMGMMVGGMMPSPAETGNQQAKQKVKTTSKPQVEYEPPEHPVTTTTKKPNVWQNLKKGQSSGAAISSPNAGVPHEGMFNQQQLQQNAMYHQQMQNQRHKQFQMQMQQQNMQAGQQQQPQQQAEPKYTQHQKLDIMARFSNSMNQMMSTFNSIRASLGKLITSLSKFVKLQ